MKKTIISLVLSACCFCMAQAQVKIGVNVCPQLNSNIGLRIGTDVEVPIDQRWSITPGAYWSLRNRDGYKNETKNGVKTHTDYSDVAHFITIPVRAGVKFPCRNENKFALKLLFGPYIAYGIDGTSKITKNTDGKITETEVGAFDAKGRYKDRFDWGFNVGLNSTINRHFTAGVFIEYGLRKTYKANNEFEDIIGDMLLVNKINMACGITLGYQF